MASPFTLFEVSWEVCNKVGGIYTVLSTKAKTATRRFGDDYVALGPWLLTEERGDVPFDEEPGFEAFAEGCRRIDLPVRIGRWRIPGSPRTILVEFSRLYEEKDAILSGLWEDFEVDSISGGWDYAEPVLFGYAAGRVIERWWEERLAPYHRRAVTHAHEWMTGAALLYLKRHVPSMGTVFTTHATMLGRALSSLGHSPEDGLGDETPEQLAATHQVVAKHSLEGVCAREADVFTTVSEITAKEAQLLHRRVPDPVLPNGIDLSVIDALAGDHPPEEVRASLQRMAGRFLGEDVRDAALLAVSGRYEFHNKGIDLLLDALAQMNGREGRRAVLFVFVPAGNSGVRSEVLERMENGDGGAEGPVGLSTHHLFDEEHDPVHEHCARIGFTNETGARIHVIQVPIYLHADDGFLNLPYEAVVRAVDLTCFPSYYEPWGYTPQESLAVGVPTITSDYAGFGRWAQAEGLGPEAGITVLPRVHLQYPAVVEGLAGALESLLESEADPEQLRALCRETAARTSWSENFAAYESGYAAAMDAVQGRLERGVPQSRRPPLPHVLEPTPEGRRPRLTRFEVTATLPYELRGLERLARNYYWAWRPEAAALFEDLSPRSWEACGRNPVAFLQRVYPVDLEEKVKDAAYLARLEEETKRLDAYLTAPPEEEPDGLSAAHPVAYFCAEFGIHESLRIYSGGLGILAGDHLKSASDLGLPLVAVGLFYRMGYFSQRLSSAGEQIAVDRENEPRELALEPVLDADGNRLAIRLQFPGRELHVEAWRVAVGRVSLYLLDTNVPANRPEDRDLTRNLYGGGSETRIQQEIVLGRGGVRLLRRLGIEPAAYHMNEGHAAFLTLERVTRLVRKEGLTFEAAREFVRATTLFTTHTPVPAGHDRFGEDLMRRYFSDASEWVGLPWERFYALGQSDEDRGEFNMTYLGLAFASYCNGVSRLHGVASRRLLRAFWPGLLESEVPVNTITNGIHLATWVDPALARLLGPPDPVAPAVRGTDFAERAEAIDLKLLWSVRQAARRRLIERVRASLERGFVERDDSPRLLTRMQDGLVEDALMIGFARRFAPYKRAQLIFRDPARLRALVDHAERPVRILIAGKAHPRDQHGQDILKGIAEATRADDLAGRVFFVEDYDMDLAHDLVQGVDVWLNNPIHMQEASGTSGMKAAANGVLNLSIGDGWWPEACDGENGWVIGGGPLYDDPELQEELDRSILYRLLEEEVVPLFFDRDEDGLPRGWLERVRHNLATIPPVFNTDRMVGEYAEAAYRPLGRRFHELSRDRKSAAKALAQERQRVRRGFPQLRIASAHIADLTAIQVGDPVTARVEVDLGSLSPADVVVEMLLGHAADNGDLENLSLIHI